MSMVPRPAKEDRRVRDVNVDLLCLSDRREGIVAHVGVSFDICIVLRGDPWWQFHMIAGIRVQVCQPLQSYCGTNICCGEGESCCGSTSLHFHRSSDAAMFLIG
jgi:hypothetical protein